VDMVADQVTRVEVKRPSNPFVLVKSGADWRFEAPAPYAADADNVKSWLKGLLDDADSTPMTDRPPDNVAGFDKPAMELVLHAGGKTRTLQVGKDFKTEGEKTGSVYYAREAGAKRVFMLQAAQVNDIRDKKIADLRDKHLLSVPDEKAVKSVTVTRGASKIEIARAGEENWNLTAPFGAPAAADEVTTLISRIRNAEAESFVEDAAKDLKKYGLDQPRVVATLVTDKGPAAIRFGKATSDGKVYAAAEGTDAVVLVTKFAFEDIEGQAKTGKLRNRDLVSLERDKISSIELRNQHGTVRLRKAGANDWEFVEAKDPKKVKANPERAQQIVDRITTPATTHVEEAPKDYKRYGLAEAAITVMVTDGTASNQVVMLGKKAPGGGYYARGAGKAVFEVPSFVFDDLNLKPGAFDPAAAAKK
jgi:hypothetical protein